MISLRANTLDEQGNVYATSETLTPGGHILRYGIFSPLRGGKIIKNEQTSTGKALSNLVMTFIRETEQIPIKKDRLLAYQYRLSNIPVKGYVKLRRILKHPSFTRPDGTVTTVLRLHHQEESREKRGFRLRCLWPE
ncbi:MAG: hypothetical protein QNL62_00550 [Gammaproteobacteria bacterium]|nr:hypothetical protein [Gammaproteobacteria bacterium]